MSTAYVEKIGTSYVIVTASGLLGSFYMLPNGNSTDDLQQAASSTSRGAAVKLAEEHGYIIID
jgi:hypothetical protein